MYACGTGSGGGAGGGTFRLRVGSNELAGRIEETGSWTGFRTLELGGVAIAHAGRHELTVEPIEIPRGALMNLQAIVLHPAGATD